MQAAYDTVIQAISGIMDATGEPDGSPTRVGTSISDILGGIFSFCGVVTALAARERTGKGTTVDVAMLDATFAMLEQGLMDALGTHERPRRLGNRHPSMAPFDTFSCADQLIAICVGNDHLFGSTLTLRKPGAYNSLGTTIPSPELDNCRDALRAEFGSRRRQCAAASVSAIRSAGYPRGRCPQGPVRSA